jgi:hypothetical protein
MCRVLKINDDVHVAVEKAVVEELISAMGETRVHVVRLPVELAL